MNSQPLVSVVIPAFNAASVLGDALRSVQEQQYAHFEVIVVDDGSGDETAAVARSFVERDERFALIQQPNFGISAARNAGLAVARGEWVAYLDADDLWLPDKLTRQVQCVRDSPELDLIFSNYYFWDGQRDLRLRYAEHKHFRLEHFARLLIRFNVISTPTVMVRRELMSRAGLFDETFRLAEDWEMWLRLAEAGCRVGRIREPLARCRVWSGNTSRQTLLMAEANVHVLKKRLRECPDARWKRAYRRSLAVAQGQLELVAARPLIEANPDAASAAVLRAWRACPRRLKWLLWFAALRWPDAVGGRLMKRSVHRKIRARW